MKSHVSAYVPAYVELVNGDILAALLFSQIIYWHLPGKTGKSKLRVKRGDDMWLAKSASDWKDEIGFTPKQAYRAVGVLKSMGLIQTKLFKFKGSPTTCIQLTEKGIEAMDSHPSQIHNPPKANSFALKGKSFTENTNTGITTENLKLIGKPSQKKKTHSNKEESNEVEYIYKNLQNENYGNKCELWPIEVFEDRLGVIETMGCATPPQWRDIVSNNAVNTGDLRWQELLVKIDAYNLQLYNGITETLDCS